MMLHRHFEALKNNAVTKHGMDVKEGQDMLIAESEEHQAAPKPKKTRKKAS